MTDTTAYCTAMLAAAAGLTLLAAPAHAETTLLMNRWLPPAHTLNTEVFEPWARQVAEATNGEVVVKMTEASLGAPARQFDLALDGIADLTFGVAGYTPGRFKLTGIAELPQVGEKGEALSVALWRVYEKYFEQAGEFRDVKLLGLFANGTGAILSTKRTGQIADIDSYAGRKFRVGGGFVQEINPALGGVNVFAPAGEIYEILEQGVADGALLPLDGYPSFSLTGVVDSVTTVSGGFYSSAWFFVMNRDTWERLTPEVQDQIMSVSGEHFARMAGRAQDEGDAEGLARMQADGVTIVTSSPEFVADIQQRTAPIEEAWRSEAGKMGVDPAAALTEFRQITTQIGGGQ